MNEVIENKKKSEILAEKINELLNFPTCKIGVLSVNSNKITL